VMKIRQTMPDRSEPIRGNLHTLIPPESSPAGRRLTLTLIGLFAGIALALLSGHLRVMAYTIASGSAEFCIRMALGAQTCDVIPPCSQTGFA